MKSSMTDLNRLLARQDFKNQKELEDFLNNLMGKSLDDLPQMDLTPEEQAEDLVFEASKLPMTKAKKKIEEALKLDPNCIDAYEFLAAKEKKLEKSLLFLEEGIAIGRKKFGGKFLKENKGEFWGWHETRSYLRCLYQKAEILVMQEQLTEGVAIMEELYELNDGDNQGVRFPLLSALILLGETEKFKRYDKLFTSDKHSAQMLYPRALFAFITEGDTPNSQKLLIKAFEKNPFVVQMLLDEDFQFKGVTQYATGSPEEAEIYLMHGFFPWHKTEGAIEWLANTTENYCKKKLKNHK